MNKNTPPPCDILIISDAWHPQINGVVRTYEFILEELDKTGVRAHVLGPADFPVRMPMPGYKEIDLTLFPYHRLAKHIKSIAPKNIHIATEGPLGWAARRYCLRNQIPFTTSYHTQFPDYVAKRAAKIIPALYRPFYDIARKLMCTFHAAAQGVYVTTDSIREQLQGWGIHAQYYPLTRGARLDIFSPEGERAVFSDLKPPLALYVGRVAIEKNIEAFLNMDWGGTKIIVGDGPARAELERAHPQVVFAGVQTGHPLAAYYRAADVFVFPSKTDTFGIVLIEALACGLPIAGYHVMGPKDIVTRPDLGVLAPDTADGNGDGHDDKDGALLGAAARAALTCSGTREDRAAYVRNTYTWAHAARQFLAGMHL